MPNRDAMSISELAEAAGVTIRTVRYYLAEGLLPPPRLQGRYTVFDQSDLNRLELIRRWKESFLPLKEIRERIITLSNAEVENLLRQMAAEIPAYLKSPPPSSSTAAPQPRGAGESEESKPALPSYFADGSYAAARKSRGQSEAAAPPGAPAHQSAVKEPGTGYEAGQSNFLYQTAAPRPAEQKPAESAPDTAPVTAPDTEPDSGQSALEYIRSLRQKQNIGPSGRTNPRRVVLREQEWRRIQIFPGFEIHISEAVSRQYEQQLEALMDWIANHFQPFR